jgi:uncharacterized membrane protein YdfJ with MMPL/SSD domain
MGATLTVLERLVARRRPLVVAAWVAVVLLALPFAFRQSENLQGGAAEVPGSGSLAVDRLVERELPGDRQPLAAVFRAEPGAPVSSRAAALRRLRRALRQTPELSAHSGQLARGLRDLRAKGSALVPLRGPADEQAALDAARELRESLEPGAWPGAVKASLIGQPSLFAAVEDEARKELRNAEAIGLPIVALVLLAVFGSLAAASLPLALGLVAVLLTGAEIYLLSRSLEMSVYVTNIASMLGIGVAVDYSLFVLARFREEVAGGASLDEARSRAMATSGVAVVFSGLAVICALATLWLIDSTLLRSLALGAILVVVAAVLLATTLLPALIGLLGQRALRRGRLAGGLSRLIGAVRRRRRADAETASWSWQAWTERVTARPVRYAAAAAAVLLVLAIPVLSLETTAGPLRQLDREHEARAGTRAAASITGGYRGTIRVAAVPRDGQRVDRDQLASLAAALRRDPELTTVTVRPAGGQALLVDAASRHDAESPEARDAVARVESNVLPSAELAGNATLHLGGEAARIRDVSNQILDSLWRIVAAALVLSFAVLVLLLRSLILPLKAVLMNLLSIGAAYGVLVAVFQWGWLDGLFGFESVGAVNNLTPPLVFAIVLGLSMDYEVFLLTRIRDRYRQHGDSRRAIAEGLASSAGTISSAALIMTAVFLVFVFTAVPSVKEIGLGNAVAIAADATLVRLVLVPATMQLFGDWNWWLPRPLAWILRADRHSAAA